MTHIAVKLRMLTLMTKRQLINQVVTTTSGTKADVEQTFDAIVEKTIQALTAGEKVELRGLGILEAKETKARAGRNPSTGEAVVIPASRRASFRPSKELKQRLAGERRERQQTPAAP